MGGYLEIIFNRMYDDVPYVFAVSYSWQGDFTYLILFCLSQQLSGTGLGILNTLQVIPSCSEGAGLLFGDIGLVGRKILVIRGVQAELGKKSPEEVLALDRCSNTWCWDSITVGLSTLKNSVSWEPYMPSEACFEHYFLPFGLHSIFCRHAFLDKGWHLKVVNSTSHYYKTYSY